MTVELGDKVKDIVTGYTGIAIAKTQWMTGCDRILVQPPVDKDGKIPEDRAFDEAQLIIIKKQAAKPKAVKSKVKQAVTGGPQRDKSAFHRN